MNLAYLGPNKQLSLNFVLRARGRQETFMRRFLTRNIPAFIYRKDNIIKLVVFTALFALFFINLYTPFNSADWYKISRFVYFLYSSLLTLTGVVIVAISRTIMYHYGKKHTIPYWSYCIWIIAEISAMAAIYTFISYSLAEPRNYWNVLKPSAKNTALIILIPYFISHLFFVLQEKNRLLNEAKERENELIGAAIQTGKNIADGTVGKKDNALIFYDDKGEMKLSIKKESLIYLESADNYVEIWYLGKKGVANYLLRNTLKNMEDKFKETNIIRTHRSFIVNFDQVKVAKRTKGGLVLDMGIDKIPEIPVSKNYGDKVMQMLMS